MLVLPASLPMHDNEAGLVLGHYIIIQVNSIKHIRSQRDLKVRPVAALEKTA